MIDKDLPKKISAAFIKLVPYVIAIASAIAAVTPNHTDDELLASLKQIVNILALNVGHSSQPSSNIPEDNDIKICTKD